jgi:tripartite-type tricarboxylate transporter receptor subunit TctC
MSKAAALVATMLAVALACAVPAWAQPGQDQYPSRPIKVVVPFPAGVLTDVVARTFADKLSTQFGKPVLIENKPGAGGALGVKAVATADPDGYTLLLTNSQYAIAPAVYKTLGYDALADLAGIALVAESPSAVIVSPKIGVGTLKEFIAAAKSQPEAFVYATAGTGSQTHLAAAYFSSQAAIKLVHLPYRNTGSIIADMLSGRTHATFAPPGFLLGQIQSGDLLALAVTSREGMTEPITAPSVNDAAIPGYEYSTWFGFFAPSHTPAPILGQLATALRAATEAADLKEKFLKSAVVTRFTQLKDFDAFVKADIEKQARIVKAAGIAAQ